MKLTKFGHACFVLEEQGKRLIVDPGAFTELPENIDDVVAIIYTHGHFDHYVPELHAKIKSKNPTATVYITPDISDEDGAVVPAVGQEYHEGPFKLEFYGKNHADKNPPTPNLGLVVNDFLAYPGDSLDDAPKPVKVLLAPANGPWMRITESMALIGRAKAELVIPTHDSLLSEAGNNVADNYLKPAVENSGGTYHRLKSGESIEI